MSTPTYAIRADTVTGVLHLKLEGFWTMKVFEAFVREIREAYVRLEACGKRMGIFSDSSSFPIQSPEVSTAFRAIFLSDHSRVRMPTAILVGSVLNKLQAERVFAGGPVRVFTDRAAASGWLEQQLAPAAAA
jgi:serine/threonine-protein kinase